MDHLKILYLFVLGLGIVQGLVLGTILYFGASKKQLSNKFLGVLLGLLSYHLITHTLGQLDILGIQSPLYYGLLEYNWGYGPLIYLYTISYLNVDFQFKKKDWWHFVPIVIEALFSLFIKLQNLFWDSTRESLSWAGYYGYILWMHTPFQYVVAAGLMFYYVWRAKKEMQEKGYREKLTDHAVQQVSLILNVYLAFCSLVIMTCLIDYLFFDYAFSPHYIFPVFLTTAVLIYWHGLVGFAKRHELPELKKLKKEGANLAILQPLKPRLIALMEEDQLYLDTRLSLQRLAEKLEIKPYLLTQLLNREFDKTFSVFIGEYRVKHVIEMMKNPSYHHYTLLAMAYESGFNSKASFNRVFKKIMGKSPKSVHSSLSGDSIR